MTKRAEILDTAKQLVMHDRAAEHGDAGREFAFAAARMTVTLQQFGLLEDGRSLDAAVVPMLLDDLKKARACTNPNNMDNFVDGCGYKALAGEMFRDVFEMVSDE